jgi:heme/copper-type cytochrome/quinol oxidase subunit 3
VVFNHGGDPGRDGRQLLDPWRTGIYTALLLLSSATLVLAERALRRSARHRSWLWLAATVILGGAFLAGQAIEYAGLLHHGVTLSSSLFGSSFFTVTGFHGIHVLGGLVVLSIFLWLGRRGEPPESRADVLSAVSAYWHFVDLVWIFVFTIVYLGALT